MRHNDRCATKEDGATNMEAGIDLSVSDAYQTPITCIADDKVLPFDTIVHNPSPIPGGREVLSKHNQEH